MSFFMGKAIVDAGNWLRLTAKGLAWQHSFALSGFLDPYSVAKEVWAEYMLSSLKMELFSFLQHRQYCRLLLSWSNSWDTAWVPTRIWSPEMKVLTFTWKQGWYFVIFFAKWILSYEPKALQGRKRPLGLTNFPPLGLAEHHLLQSLSLCRNKICLLSSWTHL